MHSGLLQQLALDGEYLDGEKMIVNAEHMVDVVTFHANDLFQFVDVDIDATG